MCLIGALDYARGPGPYGGIDPVDETELEAHCRSRMAAFKRPRAVHVVEALPKTATGKIRRFQLRAQLEG